MFYHPFQSKDFRCTIASCHHCFSSPLLLVTIPVNVLLLTDSIRVCDVKNMRIPRAMFRLCAGLTHPSSLSFHCRSGTVILNPTADLGMRIMDAFFGSTVSWSESIIACSGSFSGVSCGSVLCTFAIQRHWDKFPIKPPTPTGRITTFQPLLKLIERNEIAPKEA